MTATFLSMEGAQRTEPSSSRRHCREARQIITIFREGPKEKTELGKFLRLPVERKVELHAKQQVSRVYVSIHPSIYPTKSLQAHLMYLALI